MKLIINSNNVAVNLLEDCIYVKYDKDKYIECSEKEATAIYSKDANVIYLFEVDNKLSIINNISGIPSDWVSGKYKYENKEFVLNPNYIEPPLTTEELTQRLELLEGAMNDLIMNGGM